MVNSKATHSVSPSAFFIGRRATEGDTQDRWHGRVDEVRVCKTVRYTESLYKLVERLNADDDTLALFHMDEGEGDKLIDSSGNGHYGTIKGAKWVRVGDSESTAKDAESAEKEKGD